MITITLKNNEKKVFDTEITVMDLAKTISPRLAQSAIGAIINDALTDTHHIIKNDVSVEIITIEHDLGIKILRHTAAHVLAQAVKRIFPQAKLATGPATPEGFFYDFSYIRSFTKEDIENIETEMKKIIKENLSIEMFSSTKEDALKLMEQEPYKLELITEFNQGEQITFYKQGEFLDLCKGPHLISTKQIKHIKLFSNHGSSAAYWRGDQRKDSLNRIYGTAFYKLQDLNDYLLAREERKKRDHNKLGRELSLFMTSELIGQGLPLIMPKGVKILNILKRFVEDLEEEWGYQQTKTPLIAKSDLFKQSGHWSHYKESMFVIGDENMNDEVFALRPMTCPFQFTIYNSSQHSYRDLPIRYSETSTLFRNESSGEMHGLIRSRQFTISEGHIICTSEQIKNEFKGAISLINHIMNALGLKDDITYRLSKWDPNKKDKYIGTAKDWDKTQNVMRQLLDELSITYDEAEGEAAFYGPKLDLEYKNVHGKKDTLITVQVDFALASKFNMHYVDSDNQKKQPIIIHRTSIGCYERTLAMLIEKYAGAFPTWLSPFQVYILPISDKYISYAKEISHSLKVHKIRTHIDERAEKIGYKIREARNDRIPYIVVVGEKELEERSISLRTRNGDEGKRSLNYLIKRILDEVANKINNSSAQ